MGVYIFNEKLLNFISILLIEMETCEGEMGMGVHFQRKIAHFAGRNGTGEGGKGLEGHFNRKNAQFY